MVTSRHSRFDPDYEKDESVYEDFQDSDDEINTVRKQRRSRFEEDDEPLFKINKKRQTTLFNRTNGDAFGDFEDEEEDERQKAPFVARILAWIVMLLLLGITGYYAANYFMGYAESKSKNSIADGDQEVMLEDKKEDNGGNTRETGSIATTNYKLYIPAGRDFVERKVEITNGRIEQKITRLLEMYFGSLREEDIISSEVHFQNIFKSNDLLYINTDSDFEKMIQSMDKTKATQLITGMLFTLKNNFSVCKVKFYINSKESEIRNPIDLSVKWGL